MPARKKQIKFGERFDPRINTERRKGQAKPIGHFAINEGEVTKISLYLRKEQTRKGPKGKDSSVPFHFSSNSRTPPVKKRKPGAK